MTLRRFVTKYEMVWHALTIFLFGAAVVIVVFKYPDVSNLWVSIFVLVGSFTAAMTAMIAALKTRGEK